ncbi:MAG: hypothetical protein ABIP78_00540 [Pyrinomonadaceae bacterium]
MNGSGPTHKTVRRSDYGIQVERTLLFNEVDIDNDGVMTLELKKTTVVGRGAF